MVYRIYVEKKPGLEHEAQALMSDISSFLGIKGVERVTIVGIVEMATPCEVRHCQATHLQRVIDLPRGIDFFQAVLKPEETVEDMW